MTGDARPLVAHILHRFDTGGLENGVVNLINRMPADRYRHAVIAMTEITAFSRRIQRSDVEFIALNKPPGQGFWQFKRVRNLLRQLKPAIVHTRNLGALEMAAPAAWAGVPVRIHGEHGWDMNDPNGTRRRFQLARRLYRPFVHHYIALSPELERYLLGPIGVPRDRVTQLFNGVDVVRFHPRSGTRPALAGSPFASEDLWVVGTVGRLSAIKDQTMLARAFVRALEMAPQARQHLRLAIAGDGALRPQVEQILREGGVADLAWLAGDRSDIPDFMRALDAFALPSLAEGISNTVLEAMATALPVVATAVGGNVDLLTEGVTGRLVPASDADTMAGALLVDFQQRDQARERGRRARLEVQQRFSLDGMVGSYADLYDAQLRKAAARGALQHRFT